MAKNSKIIDPVIAIINWKKSVAIMPHIPDIVIYTVVSIYRMIIIVQGFIPVKLGSRPLEESVNYHLE